MGEAGSGLGFGGFEKPQKGPYAELILGLIRLFNYTLISDDIIKAHKVQQAIYSNLYWKMREKVPPPWPVPAELLQSRFNRKEESINKAKVMQDDVQRLWRWLQTVADILYEHGITVEYRYKGISVGVDE